MTYTLTINGTDVDLYDVMRSISAAQLAALIVDFLNGRSAATLAHALAANMTGNHRTLQHMAVDFLVGCLAEYAKQYGEAWGSHTDPRNEGAVQAANRIKALVDDGELQVGWSSRCGLGR